jgi:hypothetical protein
VARQSNHHHGGGRYHHIPEGNAAADVPNMRCKVHNPITLRWRIHEQPRQADRAAGCVHRTMLESSAVTLGESLEAHSVSPSTGSIARPELQNFLLEFHPSRS